MNKHALYYSQFCYFCQKVLMLLHGKESVIALKDIRDSSHRNELQKGGGKTQVPCLRIEHISEKDETEIDWLYESDAIIAYMKQHDLVG